MEEDLFEKILKELLNGKSLRELQEKYHFDVRIDIWTHFMRECIINYVH